MNSKYYCTHLHMHSCFEGIASMEGHMYQAQRTGVEVIWFTDHDSRMGRRPDAVHDFDFEGDDLITYVEYMDGEAKLQRKLENMRAQGVEPDGERLENIKKQYNKKVEASHGWRNMDMESPAISEIELTKENAYKGSQCMKMTVNSDSMDGQWRSAGVVFFSTAHRHVYSLLSQVTLKIACLAELLSEIDARVIFDIKLSQHPPEHKHARLKYVIGDTDGLSEDYISVISIPQKIGQWNELEFEISKDAQRYPVGGLDNVFDAISVIIQVRNQGRVVCYIDDFHISHQLEFEDVRALQQQVAQQAGEKYGVIPFVATEISAAGQHKNSFCTKVPIINYVEKNYKVSHEDAIDWVKKYGGIFSLNHPLEDWKGTSINDEERERILNYTANKYIAAKCYGASLIEVGFPEERAHFTLPYYLELWDRLSKNGIFITGYGDSDNHTNDRGWWNGNNFAAWIYAEEPTEENLIHSMKSGNLFTGDPAIFKGELSFKTSEGYDMGQVVKIRKSEYVLVFEASSIMTGWTIQWIVDGNKEEQIRTESDYCRSEICLHTKEPIHFVRVELYDDNGRCIMLTNPIYFVQGEDIDIPQERKIRD